MSIENYQQEIAALRAKLAEADQVIGRYRAALEKYASPDSWMVRDYDGANCDWIGGGEGPDIAEKALAGAKESEGR